MAMIQVYNTRRATMGRLTPVATSHCSLVCFCHVVGSIDKFVVLLCALSGVLGSF